MPTPNIDVGAAVADGSQRGFMEACEEVLAVLDP